MEEGMECAMLKASTVLEKPLLLVLCLTKQAIWSWCAKWMVYEPTLLVLWFTDTPNSSLGHSKICHCISTLSRVHEDKQKEDYACLGSNGYLSWQTQTLSFGCCSSIIACSIWLNQLFHFVTEKERALGFGHLSQDPRPKSLRGNLIVHWEMASRPIWI